MKSARELSDNELEARLPGLKAVATRHSPVCTCRTCHDYIEVGTELYERQRQAMATLVNGSEAD